jgi:hypothetical protein
MSWFIRKTLKIMNFKQILGSDGQIDGCCDTALMLADILPGAGRRGVRLVMAFGR